MKRIKNILTTLLAATAVLFIFDAPAAAGAESHDRPALPADIVVSVDDKSVTFEAYTIDGYDYLKLRDVAKVFSETRKRFDLAWDGGSNELYIYSDTAYSEASGEPVPVRDRGSRKASPATSKVYLNNQYHELGFAVYLIGDNHYFALSDLAEALDFYMACGDADTIEINTWAGYSVTGNKIYYSENIWLWDEPATGVKSTISTDIDGDDQKETVQIVVGQEEEKKWTLVYKDGDSEAAVPVFAGNEYGLVISVAAGRIVSEDAIDFLVAVAYGSTIGRLGYELYSFKDGIFTQIDISGITAGIGFATSVDENQKTARITANGAEVTVPLSDFELSNYKFYGQEFCTNFFIKMKLQSVRGRSLPDLVTTEMIVAALPLALTDLHTTYRYVDGAWQVQNVEFYNSSEATAKESQPIDDISLKE